MSKALKIVNVIATSNDIYNYSVCVKNSKKGFKLASSGRGAVIEDWVLEFVGLH